MGSKQARTSQETAEEKDANGKIFRKEKLEQLVSAAREANEQR